MARAERLLQLTDLLRGRDATTVDALADELGVSRRTILRDLGALRDRGMPITGEAGHGGGVRLEGDRGITAVHLGLEEIVAIWLAARLSQAASELPWGDAAVSGMNKLLASVPLDRARHLRALSRRVIAGPPASEDVRRSAGPTSPELLRLFETAFSSGVGLAFQYTDRAGRTTRRRIEPHGLSVEPPVWYILAHDLDKEAPRAFRMDRIVRPRLLPEVRFRPDIDKVTDPMEDRARRRPLTSPPPRRT